MGTANIERSTDDISNTFELEPIIYNV